MYPDFMLVHSFSICCIRFKMNYILFAQYQIVLSYSTAFLKKAEIVWQVLFKRNLNQPETLFPVCITHEISLVYVLHEVGYMAPEQDFGGILRMCRIAVLNSFE